MKSIIPVPQKRYRTHFKSSSSLTFTKFMQNQFIEFLPLANFLKMIQYCWNVYSHSWDFLFDSLTWIFSRKYFYLLIVNYGWTSFTLLINKIHITSTELLKAETHCLIPTLSLNPCSVDTGGCFREIMTKLEHMRKSWCITSFFLHVHVLGYIMYKIKCWKKWY